MGLKVLPKVILVAAVVVAAGFGINYGLTKYNANKANSVTGITASAGAPAASQSIPANAPAVPFTQATVKSLGSSANPLKVSLVSFHGYAPALVANGNSLTTQAGSIYANAGLNVNFVINDDVPTISTLFESGSAQCVWRTSDFWAQEQPNLRNAKLDAKAVMIVDNTQGGDAVIAKDSSIKSIEDLAGKRVALLQYTPSHGLLIDAINNSSLSAKKKASIQMVFINADEGTGGVRAAFESGKVDAAVLWDPDLALAVRNGNGHVVYSTKTATNLIFDVMVCDSRVLKTAEGKDAIQKFVAGWMQGVKAARSDKNNAVASLMATEQLFAQLGKQEGPAFVKGLFDNVVWTGIEDNARILGLTPGGTNSYERVYGQFDQIYRAAGALANPNSPVIAPQDSFDYSFIKNLLARDAAAVTQAQLPQATFSDEGLAKASSKTAALTKPVTVKFTVGSAELNQAAKRVIDTEMVPFIENNGSAYFEISGNTDSTGSAGQNKSLSAQRAAVVVQYLVSQWDLEKSRFKTVGNGSDKPICNEANPDTTLDECRAANRTTRIGLYAR